MLRALACAAAVVVMLTASVAAAQETAKEKARELYGIGNARFDAGDFQGAAQAYKQAYELVQYPIILFNLGLSYEGLGKPVEAVKTFEQVLAAPGKLKPTRVEQAKEALAKQRLLIAELQVTCNVEGATIKIDGEEVGAVPLAEPVPVASGRIILMATKNGYQAGYQTVNASGGAKLPVVIQLVEASSIPAQVKVKTTLPGADVYVDQVLVGTTPMKSTVPITPDAEHTIELRREGYVTAKEKLRLKAGAHGEVTLDPAEDRNAIIAKGGELALTLVQSDASIFVNGTRREIVPDTPLRLPAGTHQLLAERDGYDPLRLRVNIPAGGRADATVDLVPTPATRQELIDDAALDRRLGWGLGVTGVVLAGVGAGLLGWSLSTRSDTQAEIELLEQNAPNGDCGSDDACILERGALGRKSDNMSTIAVGAGIGLGVGVASLITGIYFLATGEDPDSFRLRIDDTEFALSPTFEGGPRRGTIGLRGTF